MNGTCIKVRYLMVFVQQRSFSNKDTYVLGLDIQSRYSSVNRGGVRKSRIFKDLFVGLTDKQLHKNLQEEYFAR